MSGRMLIPVGQHIPVPEAQELLGYISLSLGLTAFLVATFLQYKSDRSWVEKLARAAFISFQFVIWGTELTFVVMHAVGMDFGGTK